MNIKRPETALGILLVSLACLSIAPSVYAQYFYPPPIVQSPSLYPWSLTISDLENCPPAAPCTPLMSSAFVAGDRVRIRYIVSYANLPLGLPWLQLGIVIAGTTTYVRGYGESTPNGCVLKPVQYATSAVCYITPNLPYGTGMETVVFNLRFDSSKNYTLAASVAIGSSSGNIVSNSAITQPFTLVVTV